MPVSATLTTVSASDSIRDRTLPIIVLWVQIIVGIAFFSGLAFFLGSDLSWDTLNYHYYHGYAFVENVLWQNIQPAHKETYLNPLADVPLYFLTHQFSAKIASISIGVFQGLLYPLCWVLCWHALQYSLAISRKGLLALSTLAAIVFVAAPINILEIGTAYGDNTTAVFVVAALAITLTALATRKFILTSAAIAGVLIGIAAGLKPTNMPFVLGLGMATLSRLAFTQDRTGCLAILYAAAMYGLGVLMGVAASYGWWGAELYAHFGNPVFPLMNDVFKSPYADFRPFLIEGFTQPTLLGKILFPFTHVGTLHPLDFAGLYDLRTAIALIFIASVLVCGAMRLRRRLEAKFESPIVLIVFFAVSYVAWLYLSSCNRYMVTLELITPAVCIACISLLTQRRSIILSVIIALCLIIPASSFPGHILFWHRLWERGPWESNYFGVISPLNPNETPKGTIVFILGDKSVLGYALPSFSTNVSFIRIGGTLYSGTDAYNNLFFGKGNTAIRQKVFGNALGREICQRFDAAQGPLYAMRFSSGSPLAPHIEDEDAMLFYGLKVDDQSCTPVPNRIFPGLELCKAARRENPECRTLPKD